jgi:hypothetical protein
MNGSFKILGRLHAATQRSKKMSAATKIDRESITKHDCDSNTSSPLRQVEDKPLSLSQGLVPGTSEALPVWCILVGDSCLVYLSPTR